MLDHGIRIIESQHLGTWECTETARSKKRRQRKAFAKASYRSVWVEDQTIYETSGGFICSPSVARELRRQLASRLST